MESIKKIEKEISFCADGGTGEIKDNYEAGGGNNEALAALNDRYEQLNKYKHFKNKQIAKLKEKLTGMLFNYQEWNKEHPDCVRHRQLNQNYLIDSNVISVFESSLTRIMGIQTDELTTDIIIIRVFYFDILRELMRNGFMYKGEKYIFFTASAGQIRTKKTVFIKESAYKEHEKTLMCGLDIDAINEQGGVNVN